MNINKIEMVIFDCDGVLVDSEIISGNLLISLLAPLGVHIDFAYVQENFIGRSFQKVASEIGENFGLTLPSGFEKQYRAELLKSFETELRPTDGIVEILQTLNIPKCVATSSSPERVGKSLQIVNLTSYFVDQVFTASLVENGKPAPDLFLLAADKMGVDPKNCLVIEDSIPGIRAAINAKMQVFHYAGGGHLKNVNLTLNSECKPQELITNWDQMPQLLPALFTN